MLRLLAGALLMAAPVPANAVANNVVAVPGSFFATYATPVVVHAPGAPITFTNLDLPHHDVVADDTRAPGSAPWCPAGGPRCPLFFSEQIGVGQSTPIVGLEDVPSGTYTFRCTPHPWMQGTLIVP